MTEIDHHAASRTLRIRFADGHWYSYFDVPREEHDGLRTAEPHGRYFQAHIRDRYRYRRD